MKIKISNKARDQIKEISQYIAEDSVYYAKKTANEIYDKIYSLETGINLGRKVPELDDDVIRELLYKSYRIIFEIIENEVSVANIIQVFHGSRDFSKTYKIQ